MEVAVFRRLVIATCLVAGASACTGQSPDAAKADEPDSVFTMPEGWRLYPQAIVSGELSLDSGCLFIGDYVAIWPHGAKWDAAEQSVTFEEAEGPSPESGEHAHPPARLGEHFRGAGGSWSRETFRKVWGQDAAGAVDVCVS